MLMEQKSFELIIQIRNKCIATAIGMSVHPYLFMIAGTMAASLAFMLPVATPADTVIFGSGYIGLPEMAKTGFGLNMIGIVITTISISLLAISIFKIILTALPEWIK